MGIAERKERERLRRRNEIIDAAERLYFRDGLEVPTMEDVAAEAELSKGTLYLYFQSRDDLKFAVFIRGIELLMDMMDSVLDASNSGYRNLLELAACFIEFSRKYKDYFTLFMHFESNRMEELNINEVRLEEYLREQSPFKLVENQVKKGIEDGSLRADLDHETFSATLWSQMLGVLMVLHNKADLYEIFNLKADEILQTHLELVAHGALGKKNKSYEK